MPVHHREHYSQWKITGDGYIESEHCPGMLLDRGSGEPQITLRAKSDTPSQVWNVVSSDVVLIDARGNSTQTWSPVFIDPGYELLFNPSFCDITNGRTHGCLNINMDREISKREKWGAVIGVWNFWLVRRYLSGNLEQ